MSKQEIKSVLHESMENIDDEKFLEAMRVIIELKYKSMPALKISERQKKIIDESAEQIENGEFYSDEVADKITDEWLKD